MFKDRIEAGVLLAQRLKAYEDKDDVVVFGIPRGGVPIAKKVAELLSLPLDVIVTRKIGAPMQEELAIGAVGEEDVLVLDKSFIERLSVGEEYIEEEVRHKKKEIKERLELFRGDKKELNLSGKTAILVDDGIATGSTVEAAIESLRKKGVGKVVLAVPVSPKDSAREMSELVDELVILKTPGNFRAVGQFYKKFNQVTNDQVVEMLQE